MQYLNKPVTAICLAVASAFVQAQEATYEFNIPAQSVSQVLNALAKQTGLQPFFIEDSVKGVQSGGIKGKLSLREALDKALAGTGLTYQFTGEKAVAIKVAEKVAELTAITVTSSTAKDATVGYQPKRSFAGTKTDTPLLETPMAVQVVPREVMDDRISLTALDAAKNVSGVQSEGGNYYDQFQIRGFSSGYGSIFRDGLQLLGITGSADMAFVERVEVVKGPASMLYGRVEPGGFVNLVTKKPQEDSTFSFQQQIGSWGRYRTVADATGKVNEDGSVLYRVIGVLDKADSFIDFAHQNNKALLASVAVKPTSRFEANVNLEYYDQKFTSLISGLIPVSGKRPLDLPRNFTTQDPAMWSSFPSTHERTRIGFDWSYVINENWKIANRFQYTKVNEHTKNLWILGFNGVDTVTRHLGENKVDRDIWGTNLDLTGVFNTGTIRHKVLIGADMFKYDDIWHGSGGPYAPIPIPALNIYNPAYGNFTPALQALFNRDSTNTSNILKWSNYGVYAQDQISLNDKWDVLLGGRYDTASAGGSSVWGGRPAGCYPNCTGGAIAKNTDNGFSPRAALLYKLNKSTSLYGSYSKSFGTNNGVSATGQKFDPQVGTQYEVGIKANPFGGQVMTSATLFDLTKTNLLQANPADGGLTQILIGEIRSRGLELDVSGQVTQHVSLVGSYTYNDVIQTKDVTGNQGKRLKGAAPHSASFWAKYDTAPGSVEGWAVGAGVYLIDQREGNNANTWQLPGYAVVDAMLAYRTKAGGNRLTFQLNLQNLFDKKYFDRPDYDANAYYGAPRNATASIKVDF